MQHFTSFDRSIDSTMNERERSTSEFHRRGNIMEFPCNARNARRSVSEGVRAVIAEELAAQAEQQLQQAQFAQPVASIAAGNNNANMSKANPIRANMRRARREQEAARQAAVQADADIGNAAAVNVVEDDGDNSDEGENDTRNAGRAARPRAKPRFKDTDDREFENFIDFIPEQSAIVSLLRCCCTRSRQRRRFAPSRATP